MGHLEKQMTLNCVQYHFDVSKRSTAKIYFHGRTITASEAIAAIIKQKNAFEKDELHLFDVQTKVEYRGSDPITRNTFLVVKRAPSRAHMKKVPPAPSTGEKKKAAVVAPPEEDVEAERARLRAEEEKIKQEEEYKALLCRCGRLLRGATFVACCGKTVCGECAAQGVCPECGVALDNSNSLLTDTVQSDVLLFLESHPQLA